MTPGARGRRSLLRAAALAPLLAACGRTRRFAEVASGETVLAFGDSVTYGTGASPGEDWPSRLEAATGWRVVNAGVPGDTAVEAKSRLPALLEEHRPSLTIVEIGGNDFLRRRPAKEVKEDLRALLRMARDAGSQPVLVAVPELSLLGVVAGKPSDSPIYAELADEERVPLIPEVFSGVLGRAELRADAIHPNSAGYRAMAEGIAGRLKAQGLLGGR